MIRKLASGEYRLYSRKKDPKTGKRRNLGTFKTRAAAETSRRHFMKLMGGAAVLSGLTLASCRRPIQKVMPFTKHVEWLVPGKPLLYATVMPGDLVFGDSEGVYFMPPALVQQVVDNADVIHIHDEWTRMKFDEGKYKSSEIYGSPRDPALKKEYDEYLKKRLEEIRKK